MSDSVRVLLVEDNPGDSEYVKELLVAEAPDGFTFIETSRLEEAVRLTVAGYCDVVLLDLGLPDSSGLSTLQAMRDGAPEVPVVVVTGNEDDTVGLAVIKEGAQDFVSKGQMGGAYLAKTLSFAIERHNLVQRLHESEERLYQSQKLEALGQLAGGIAHDFNNLLTTIEGYSELLMERPEVSEGPARTEVAEIRRAADRAEALTRQVLAFGRRQALRPQVTDLGEVVERMAPLISRTLGENIDVRCIGGESPAMVSVDTGQFENVLLNLALNARDAMPLGGRLTIETAQVELDGDYCRDHPEASSGIYVMLGVTDTGIGMDEITKSRIFEPFFTTKAVGLGTGLGLASVYGIVNQSRGSIDVHSAPGQGTTIKLYLPRVVEFVVSDETGTELTTRARLSSGGEKILVVEDEDALRNLIVSLLGSLGYDIVSAPDATEALRLVNANHKVDLLLTDMVLTGGIQGAELSAKVREVCPHLGVLYMSGYGGGAFTDGGSLEEGACFLQKPFGRKELAEAVRLALVGDCA